MGEYSKIEWTDHTFNPWIGCQRVSPGCEHCYAEAYAKRIGHGTTKPALWGPTAERRVTSEANWRQPLKWNRESAIALDHEAVDRRARVFCSSLADVFEDRPELAGPRARLFGLILATPHLDWLLLTKRPENADRLWRAAQRHDYEEWAGDDAGQPGPTWRPNVWLGTTVEDQRRADERIPHLLAVPAAIRFLSCEPLLGSVDLCEIRIKSDDAGRVLDAEGAPFLNALRGSTYWPDGDHGANVPPLSWVIAGGESGPGARPMHPAWARSLRDQCAAADVPFLFKQWGEYNAAGAKVGKAVAGRVLDGHTHDALPPVVVRR